MSDKLKLEILFEAIDDASKNIKGIDKNSKEMAKAVGEARDRLRALNKQAGDMRNFVTLKNDVGATRKELEAAQQRVNKLAAEMKKVETPTKAMSKEFAKAKAEAGGLKDRLAGQNIELQKLRDKLAGAGVSTSKFVEAEKKLRDEIKKTNAEFQARKGEIAAKGPGGLPTGGGSGSTLDSAAKAGIIGLTAAEIKDFVIAPISAAARAETQMTDIGIKADLSRKELAKMSKEIEALAPKVKKTAEEVRDSVDFLAAAGVDPRKALRMAAPINKASSAFHSDSRETATATHFALKNLKIPLGQGDKDLEKKTRRILDMTAMAGNVGALEFKDWAKWSGTLTTSLSGLGAEGERAYASMLALGEATFTGDADQTLNNVQNLLAKLSSEEVLKNYAERGVDLRKEVLQAARENRDIFDAVNQATIKATGGKDEDIMLLVNDMQARNALIGMRKNWDQYKSHVDKIMNDSNGTVDKAFAKTAQSTQSKWDETVAHMKTGLERVGTAMKPITNGILDAINRELSGAETPYAAAMNKKAAAERAAEKVRQNQARAEERAAQAKFIADMKALNSSGGQGIGSSLISGILMGLRIKKEQLRIEMNTLASMLPQWMKGPLKINSPSRVFADIGGGVIEGLNLGIDRDRASTLDRMRKMAIDTANSFRPSLTAPSFGAGGRQQGAMAFSPSSAPQRGIGGNYTFNITQLPGEDGEALANRVVAKLDRLERDRANSSYDDG